MGEKNITTVLISLFAFSPQAQEQNTEVQFKNKFMVGGNINLDIEHDISKDFTTKHIVGYFTSNEIANGLSLNNRIFDNVNYTLDRNNPSDFSAFVSASGNAFGLEPFITYQHKITKGVYHNITESSGYEASGKLETEDIEEIDMLKNKATTYSVISQPRNPEKKVQNSAIRLQVLLFPGVYYEQLLFKPISLQPGAGLGYYLVDFYDESFNTFTFDLSREMKIYLDSWNWDWYDKLKGGFVGLKASHKILLNNKGTAQQYDAYIAYSGRIYKKIYWYFGLGLSIFAFHEGTVGGGFNLPGGIGLKL